jgi:hypothetical protein
MMSEIEDESSSVIDLELIAQKELERKKREKSVKVSAEPMHIPQPPAPEPESVEILPPTAADPQPQKASSSPEPEQEKIVSQKPPRKKQKRRLPANTDKATRFLEKKHQNERKALEKKLKDEAKKRERDVRDLTEKALKAHFEQADKERHDFLALLVELKYAIAAQSKDALESTQHLATAAAEGEVERMVNWFHEEFMKELDKKAKEYEELKASAENQVNKMTEESDGKSQQIMLMDEKIKEIATLLPDDVRKDILEELGLGHLATVEKPSAMQTRHQERPKTGFMSKLASLFSRKPRKVPPKPKVKKEKQVKKTHPKQSEAQVIAQ